MRKATENQGNTRKHTENLSPRNKVKDLVIQQHFRSHFTPFLQETPVKPSQVPNWLSHPPSRRMLPFQSPEPCYRDRLGPPWHPPYPPGPVHSSGFVPSSPTNIGASVNRFQTMPRGRLGPQPHQQRQPSGSFCPSGYAPVTPTSSSTTANRPPGIFYPAPPQFMKDLSNHSPSSHIRRDQGTESKDSWSYSGNKNVTAQRQDSNKAQSSEVRGSIQTIQLHRPPITSSFNTRAVQGVCTLAPSGSEHWSPASGPPDSQVPPLVYQPSPSPQSSVRSSGSSLPNMHSPVAPCQDQQHKRTPSRENLIPVVDYNCSSQKRCREFEDCDDSAKKLCLPAINTGKAQTPKPTVGNSLNTSLMSQPSSRHSSVLELSPKTIDRHLCSEPEPARGQSACLELSSMFKPTQSSCASLTPKTCVERQPSTGAQQACLNFTQNHTLLIELRSPPKPDEESLRKRSVENDKRDRSDPLLSSEVPQKDTGSSPHAQFGNHLSGHTHRNTSVLPVKTLSRGNHVEESRKSDNSTPKPASKTNSGSLSCRTAERTKNPRPKRSVAIPNDIDELFTPDPLTYVFSTGHKTVKLRTDGIKSPSSEKGCPSSTVTSSSTSVTASLCRKTGSSHAVDTQDSSPAPLPQVYMPTVALERVKLENLKPICSKNSKLKKSPTSSSGRQLKDESVKSDEKHTSLLPNNVGTCALETETVTTTATSHHSPSPLLERQASEGRRKTVSEEDPIDVELDLDLSFAVDVDLTQSSQSSEDEQLISLQEMMERVTKPPDTPEKGAFSEPSTPGHRSSQSKTPLPSTTKCGTYKNNLDQMLKEINSTKRAKELEAQLLTACEEDLLRIAEYEEAEENREEGVSTEQQEFLQRYSLMSNAIREVPPGEVVFNLEKFGQIFSQDTLQLRQCMVSPQGAAQKTLLWSSPAQLRLHLNIGLFQEAFDCHSPCPAQVTRFLFKMMSVHNERIVSEKILQALCDIACTAAYQIVKNGNQQFKVWVPSLADVALVLMNMGIAFVTLFPFENLQPPFTEGDLLEDICIKSESPSSNKEQTIFPEHNCNNILKYLSYCMGLCPKAYSDDELLLLLTVVGRVGLDTRLILQSSVELYPLQYKVVNNIKDWDTMLPRICRALTDLTDDHHNMCLLVQLLPDNTRGKQLRRHLSLSMISKLLDGNCTYRPTEKEFQLSKLRPYLPRMQPSTLLRCMLSSSSRSQKEKEDDMNTLDQQSYYLCYSLLTLANEASNFQFFPAHQKKQLLVLCYELETHVKCDIRESEKCLYRSKVKDLVARIYTKWSMLLQRTRPLHGKLYDYWQPLSVDTLTSSQEEEEVVISDDEEGPVMEESEEEEPNETGTEEVAMISEDEDKEERDDTTDDTDKTEDYIKPDETEADDTMDTNKMRGDVKPEETVGDDTVDTNETGGDVKPDETEADSTIDTNKMRGDIKPEETEGDDTVDTNETGGDIKPDETEADDIMDTNETGGDVKPEGMEGDNAMDDTKETEEATETILRELNHEMPEMEPYVHEQVEARNAEHTEVETENLVEARKTSHHNQVAACDLL
ncbi:SMC5-SMC6 complex localization factor protein 2 isoform X1 [Epinephelus moara]|uniref:SMC5-SMC6 complex localization factor protein 2 isoform X1 n=2 Tax=Epinephelus moara TaxID=300413 RepID=UPI00214E98C0|nr:SMC5-SMC6 complex localization factor protein 2 isoform X1 [Epinephelus moara]